MIKYKYTAKNLAGKQTEGEYLAADMEELREYLRGQGYYLSDYKVLSDSSKEIRFLSSVKLKDLAIFCRQFAVLFSSGVNIAEAINILSLQTKNKKFKNTLSEIYEDIRKGRLLSEAMELHHDVFPEFLRSMVRVGEVSGNLDLILTRMAEYYEKNNKIKNKVTSAMIYPIILLVLMLGVLIMLFTFVLPIFADTLAGFGGEMPAITVALMAVSAFMQANFLYIMIGLVGTITLLYLWGQKESGRYFFDSLKLAIPVVKNVQRKVITTRFARSLGVLLYSGISMLDSIDIISSLIGNTAVEERFKLAKEEVKKGYELSVALEKVEVFSPLLIEMISVGQKTGQLDDMLLRTADFFDDEVEEAINRATTLIEPIMIISLAIIVGIVILSIMLPMTEIMQSAMSGM